jgi:SIR2-like domain
MPTTVATVGHLFVAHGDLTKLACDGLLIPCDSEGNVRRLWAPVLPPGLPVSTAHPDWVVLPGRPNEFGVISLDTVDDRRIWAFVTVDFRSPPSPADVAARTWAAVTHVSTELTAAQGREVPLLGMPLAGTGHAGLEHNRGGVIDYLLSRHRETDLKADVALVLWDRRDFAAVQERRRGQGWGDLADDLRQHADRLGSLAAKKQLSLFLGAGVSRPAGLPDWWQLLDELADEAGVPPASRETDPFDAGVEIVEKLGERFHDEVAKRLDKRRHAIGHALLATLRADRMVTTNFDDCMELALKIPATDGFRVLARQLADGSLPWLLKLNGDVHQPDSIVLSAKQLLRHGSERAALEGVVQTLLLTSHLLFVGFSLTDTNFLKLADAVSKVRALACGDEEGKPLGTAVALTTIDRDRAGYSDLHMLAMDESSPARGARRLEIFLDRLVWSASVNGDLSSEYLLDDRYQTGLSAADVALRVAVLSMAHSAGAEAKASSAWNHVRRLLADLGADGQLGEPLSS